MHLEHTHLIATRLHLWVSNPKKFSFSISGMQTRLHALPHSSFKYSTCRHSWPVCHIALFYMLQADMAAQSATIHLSLSCIKTHLPSLPLFDVLNADTAAQSATFHLPVSFTKMWLTSRRHRKTGFFGMQTLWLIWSYPTLKYHTDADVDAPVSINHVCPLRSWNSLGLHFRHSARLQTITITLPGACLLFLRRCGVYLGSIKSFRIPGYRRD